VGDQLPSHRAQARRAVVGQDGVAALDVLVVAQDGLFRPDGLAVGAEVPLQVSDPENQLGDLFSPALISMPWNCAGVTRTDSMWQHGLRLAQRFQQDEHLPSRRLNRSRVT